MKTLIFLLEKEFRQILRNKGIVRMLLIAPVIQLILLPLAADYSVKNISIVVVDNDHSPISQRLIGKITASGHFRLTGYTASYNEALTMVEQDRADIALQIPTGFERDLVRENSKQLFMAVNAIEGTKANLGGAYLNTIIRDYNSDIRIRCQSAPSSPSTASATTAPNPSATPAASSPGTAPNTTTTPAAPSAAPQISAASSNW